MKKKIVSAVLSTAMLTSAFAGISIANAEGWSPNTSGTPAYQQTARLMEKLNRGLVAVYTTPDSRNQTKQGVVLSWRLLGDEDLTNQAFKIYRDGVEIHTTGVHDATYYLDPSGKATNKYKVVRADATAAEIAAEPEVTPSTTWVAAKGNEVGSGNSMPHSYTYVDIPISMPTDIAHANTTALSNYSRDDASGGANDASVGDLDGDGDYEIVLKWDPNDSRDSAGTTTTGHCVIDAYEIDPNNTGYKWRIDLGDNITAGAHYTQFMVYDYDGDGKSEVAMVTARGSYSIDIDGEKHYVTEVGDTDEIRNANNSAVELSKGKNIGPEYITIFSGETGRPLRTTAGIPLGSSNGSDWGDSKLNRSARYLAAVAYLDGVHPSYIAIRGMYNRSVLRAYNWDGQDFSLVWEHDSGKSKDPTKMYGQGNHNLSVADIDNDGKDEIVYGSACLDDDGVTVLGNTLLGHGDAMHTSDFNNDGVQEVFSVKEDSEGFKRGTDFRVAKTGEAIWSKSVKSDNGRGVMGNIDDAYAATHPDALALGWAAAHDKTFDFKGNEVAAKPASAGKGDFCNFLVYWDGDLASELLDANIIQKYDAAKGWTKRFYGPSDGYTLSGQVNNGTKRNYSLVADLWGDWREEIIMPITDSNSHDTHLRIFTSIVPTEYRLTTLMHDCQYREAIAWQNVGYNQPPHTSYYIGSAALATDSEGKKLNYLAPATRYTKVVYEIDPVAVTGISLSPESFRLEKGKTQSVTANITPSDATKKGVTWTSSNESVAVVSTGGTVKGVNPGKATITATTNDGGFTDSCEVEVWSNPVTGISVSENSMTLGTDCSKQLIAQVMPADASDTSFKWVSSNPAVASVDENGVVYGMTSGLAVISAVTDEGNFTANCTVNVVPLKATDLTGSDKFTTTNTDTESVLSDASESSATLTQTKAKVNGEFHRTFTKVTDSKAMLSFRFTTGGMKDENDAWNWDGREYTMSVQFLGENDSNILTLSQPYASKAGTLTSAVGNEAAESFASAWSTVVDGIGNIQGSAKRWIVNIEFDYDNDTAKATVIGTDGTWEAINGQYTKEFDLNGLNLEKMVVSTVRDGDGVITAAPSVAELKYEKQEVTLGATKVSYEKGTNADTAWAANDVTDWTVTGTDLKYSADAAENGRVYFSETKPGAAYSASKTFDVDDKASTVTYDVDWYFGNANNRLSNFEYLQFGNKLRLGWTKGYMMFVSTDGGTSYDGIADDAADSTKAIFTGSNSTFVKHVKVVFDPQSKTIQSLKFDGNEIAAYSGYKLPDDATMDSVSFGFTRGGGTDDWEYPNGIDSILVSQFVEGEEPVIPTIAPTDKPDNTIAPTDKPDETTAPTTGPDATEQPSGEYGIGDVTVVDNTITTVVKLNADTESAAFIAASYDTDGRLTALTAVDVADIKADEEKQVSAAFAEPLAEGTQVKLFLFDSIAGQKPLCDAKGITVPSQSAQLSDIVELFDTDLMVVEDDTVDEIEFITE